MFTVSSVIDGDTFEVDGGWKWQGQTGTRVRPTGFDAPELGADGGRAAKQRLERLILGQEVELRAAYRVDHGRLVCDVFLRGRNLSELVPAHW
jgi:endonuclease YncB( thermonuclease family)